MPLPSSSDRSLGRCGALLTSIVALATAVPAHAGDPQTWENPQCPMEYGSPERELGVVDRGEAARILQDGRVVELLTAVRQLLGEDEWDIDLRLTTVAPGGGRSYHGYSLQPRRLAEDAPRQSYIVVYNTGEEIRWAVGRDCEEGRVSNLRHDSTSYDFLVGALQNPDARERIDLGVSSDIAKAKLVVEAGRRLQAIDGVFHVEPVDRRISGHENEAFFNFYTGMSGGKLIGGVAVDKVTGEYSLYLVSPAEHKLVIVYGPTLDWEALQDRVLERLAEVQQFFNLFDKLPLRQVPLHRKFLIDHYDCKEKSCDR